MATFKNDQRFLGYGGPGPPLSQPFNPDRAGEPLPPTGRELGEYGIHLLHDLALQYESRPRVEPVYLA